MESTDALNKQVVSNSNVISDDKKVLNDSLKVDNNSELNKNVNIKTEMDKLKIDNFSNSSSTMNDPVVSGKAIPTMDYDVNKYSGNVNIENPMKGRARFVFRDAIDSFKTNVEMNYNAMKTIMFQQ